MTSRRPNRWPRALLALVSSCLLLALAAAAPALAATAPAPYWQLSTAAVPTNLHPGTVGRITLAIANHGDAPTSGNVTITDKLPPELKFKSGSLAAWPAFKIDEEDALACEQATLTCTYTHSLPPGTSIKVFLEVEVKEPTGGEPPKNEIAVSGGGAPSASSREPVTISSTEAPFGVNKYSFVPEEEGGAPDARAGSHPFQLTTNLALNQTSNEEPVQLPREFQFKLPAGLLGNPTTVPKCSQADFNTVVQPAGFNLCPADTAIGVAELTVDEPVVFKKTAGTESVPVFLLEPGPGEPARLGLVAVNVPVVLDTSVRTGEDYGVTVSAHDNSQLAGVLATRVMVWGVPGDPRHDSARGWQCVKKGLSNPACAAQVKEREETQKKEKEEGKSVPAPFLTMPTSCSTPITSPMTATSWAPGATPIKEVESEFSENLEPSSCLPLSFAPSIEVTPDSSAASTPTGLGVTIKMPQEETAEGTAASAVKSTTVDLPEGVQLNPAAANGLQACTALQIGLLPGFSEPEQTQNDHFSSGPPLFPGPGQPATLCEQAPGSKVGTVEIESPDLETPIKGYVYLASQDTNPFHAPLVVYLIAEDPKSGVLVKLAGTVSPEEGTGRVISTFENTPQVPFKQLKLHFFNGPRASLSTPEFCGPYATTTSFAPWSGNEAATPAPKPFEISTGCPPSNPQPFEPSFAAGSNNLQAGAFTSFTVNITRPDGQQALTGISVHLPAGIAGVLASVTPCPEPPPGQEWSCGANSVLGHSTSSSGLGNEPFSLGGTAYLTTGYDGAPFGLLVITPAVAGPFNLGNVDVRSRINVDPNTAAVTITTDPGPHGDGIPTMLKGVPVQLKQLTVNVDRAGFQFNPTNCDPKKITGTLSGANGGSHGVESNFQVANCASLPFAPKLVAETTGVASKVNGALLDVNVESPGMGQANIEKVFLTLPASLPSRLTTIQKACPDTTFNANPATCDEGSVIGKATIHTPVFKNPLVGPAYLVSHGNAAFPDVEFVLQGEGVTIVLDGKTDIKKGITYSRFESAPDAPFTKFETELPMGPHSALTAYTPSTPYNLCPSKLEMPTEITGQNGAVIKEITHIAVKNCKGVLSAKETNAQKLAKALKACKTKYKKNKKKRQACEKAAHKKYGPKKASKKKKKK